MANVLGIKVRDFLGYTLIVTILVCNTLVNKITGASLDKGIGG